MASLVLLTLLATCVGSLSLPEVQLVINSDTVQLGNGFAQMVFNKMHPQVSSFGGSFNGTGKYTTVTTSQTGPHQQTGLVLEVEQTDGSVFTSCSSGSGAKLNITVLTNSSNFASVEIAGIVDNVASPTVMETWRFSLAAGARGIDFAFSGTVLKTTAVRAVRRSIYLETRSLYAFFSRGVVQMMNYKNGFFCSSSSLTRWYSLATTMDGTGTKAALDVTHGNGKNAEMDGATTENNVIVISGGWYNSGMQTVMAGQLHQFDRWTDHGWNDAPATNISEGQTWSSSYNYAPNDGNFPAGPNALGKISGMGYDDIAAYLTGIYASIVGNMVGYDRDLPGQIATTIHTPGTGYAGLYNFFDPDNYLGLSTVMYSGDPYLLEQARIIMERTGSKMKPSGQVPHHFIESVPTYRAISGALQTGPNLFWTSACLQYASLTGDNVWLRNYIPVLRQSAKFLLHFRNSSMGLLQVPGSLMIDVFIRTNFTSDSNVAMVWFLNNFAEAEMRLGNTTGARYYRNIAKELVTLINEHIWHTSSNDHYVTQRNPDGSIRDFIDYDSNTYAVAFGVAGAYNRSGAVLHRVDSGKCTHAKATYVSERYYGPKDCFKHNVGDSCTTMGRIGWGDAHARRVVGDWYTFNEVILKPLQTDVLYWTWIRERYDCTGKQQLNRTRYYFEYPAVVTMMLREIKYGINIGLNTIDIKPWNVNNFVFSVGTQQVHYSAPHQVKFSFDVLKAQRTYNIHGMTPSKNYTVQLTGGAPCGDSHPTVVASSPQGVVKFQKEVQANCWVEVLA